LKRRPGAHIRLFMKKKRKRAPSTHKVRRDLTGGKRGDGHRRRKPIRRPNPQRIRIGKPDPSLTAVAGLVMFGVFLRRLGIDEELREAFGLLKSGDSVYPMGAQLRMLIDMFVVGEHRVFGLESFAADVLFARLAGGIIPSIDTVYRDLSRFDRAMNARLERMMVEQGLADVRSTLRSANEVHLDIDTTVNPLFCEVGAIEGAELGANPKYHGRPSYHPVLARIAETDTCVGALLRSGDTSFGATEVPVIVESIDRVREVIGPDRLLYVRIDAAGDCTEVMSAVDARGCFYITRPRLTQDLLGAIWAHAKWRTVDWDADNRPIRQVATIAFTREEWRKHGLAVRVVAVRSRDLDTGRRIYLWDDNDYTVQAFLTNDTSSDEDDIAQRYDKRAGIEPLIAEFKTAWGIGKVSSVNFEANYATLLLKLLTHNLLRRYVNKHLPKLRSWRAPWIRRAAILVPGRLVRSSRVVTMYMAPRPILEAMRN
jgi:hypothetical protein